MSMKEYTEIKNAQELDVFLHQTITFHDSMLKELQMINRGYVMKNKSMNMCHRFDARILFQTQFDPIAFELICENVKHISSTGAEEFMRGGGKFTVSPEQLIELSLDYEFVIQCKRLFYKLTPELHGNNEHLGSQVPSSKMVSAEILENEWRQCGNCSEAWQVPLVHKIATCPSCNQISYLSHK